MCTVAAYIGDEQAAPILLRMIGNEEGYAGGQYTGLATIHEGKLYYAKVCGDLAELLKRTDALSLPGTIGIAHSRTPGIPSDEWAHPFISTDESVAYIANGAAGMFAGKRDFTAIYQRLAAAGDRFRTLTDDPSVDKAYPRIPDGRALHTSDLLCGMIAENHLREGMNLPSAMGTAYLEAPSEVVGLSISVKEPDAVAACRINMPLMWGRKGNACYLATTALAMEDEDLDNVSAVPSVSTVCMRRGQITYKPIGGKLARMCVPMPWAVAIRHLDEIMSDGKEHHIGDMYMNIESLWPEGSIQEAAMLTFQYVHEEVKAGRLKVVKRTTKASLPGAIAPRWYFQRRGAEA